MSSPQRSRSAFRSSRLIAWTSWVLAAASCSGGSPGLTVPAVIGGAGGGTPRPDGASEPDAYDNSGTPTVQTESSPTLGVTRDWNGIAQRAPLPDLARAIDVDAFHPGGEAGLRALFPLPAPVGGHFNVVDDGNGFVFPTCAAPVRLGAAPATPPIIDGDLADWRGVSPEIFDREGDGSVLRPGASVDLIRVFHSSDQANHYFAFVMKDDWPTADSLPYVKLQQDRIVLPTSNATATQFAPVQVLAVQPRGVYRSTATSSMPLPEGRFSVAVRGRVLELRLDRGELDARAGGSTWLLDVAVSGGRAGVRLDRSGALVMGVPTDYGCMVALPADRAKLFVLRRSADVTPEEAEIVYRSALAAPAYVEAQTAQGAGIEDTVNVIVVRAMSVSGLNRGTSGMTLALTHTTPLGLPPSPLDHFEVAAHEYAHTMNAGDWELPLAWMKEGHSEQSAFRAVGAAFNAAVAERRYRARLGNFVDDEETGGVAGLEPEPWPAPGKSVGFHYHKAHAFIELLGTVVPYQLLNGVWSRYATDGTRYASGMALLDAITRTPAFTAPVSPSMWNGWFSGTYDSGLLARSLVEIDTDGDGLLDYRERLLGLAPDQADSDHDGVSDLFELAAGTDPNTPEPLRALTVDNHLGDWDTLAPGALQAVTPSPSTPPPTCTRAPALARAGARYDGEWLVVAVDLSGAVTDPDFQIDAHVTEPSGRTIVLTAHARDALLFAHDGSNRLRPAPLASPLTGRQIELAYRPSWFGWKTLPDGVKVRLVTSTGPQGMTRICAESQALAVSTAMP